MTDYNDGKWHGWNGGDCPVHPKSVVDVAFTNRNMWCMTADACNWNDYETPIVAFRVVKPYREPREWWIDPVSGFVSTYYQDGMIHVRDVVGE